jgi:hypothetical protein
MQYGGICELLFQEAESRNSMVKGRNLEIEKD